MKHEMRVTVQILQVDVDMNLYLKKTTEEGVDFEHAEIRKNKLFVILLL